MLAPLGPGQRWVVVPLGRGASPWLWKLVGTDLQRCPWWTRVCTLCDAGCVEDEIHFITTCRALHDERYNLFCNLARVDSEFLLLNNYESYYTLCPQTQMCALLPKVYITCTNYGCHYCISSRTTIISLLLPSFLLLSLSLSLLLSLCYLFTISLYLVCDS